MNNTIQVNVVLIAKFTSVLTAILSVQFYRQLMQIQNAAKAEGKQDAHRHTAKDINNRTCSRTIDCFINI